jgi:hypothetical protein
MKREARRPAPLAPDIGSKVMASGHGMTVRNTGCRIRKTRIDVSCLELIRASAVTDGEVAARERDLPAILAVYAATGELQVEQKVSFMRTCHVLPGSGDERSC